MSRPDKSPRGSTNEESTGEEKWLAPSTGITRRWSVAAIVFGAIGFLPATVRKTFMFNEADGSPNRAAESFGAVGGGIADDTIALKQALSSANVVADGIYLVADLEITESAPVHISGSGTLKTLVVGKPAFHINSQGRHMRGGSIEGLKLRQPHDPHLSKGTANDHACLKIQGVDGFVARDLDMSGSDIAASFCFGSANLPNRANLAVAAERFRATGLRGMGLELAGCQGGSFTGHHFSGTDGAGGRAMFHGVRFVAYPFAPNENLNVSAIVENFRTGASFQRYTTGVTCRLTAKNCTYGVQVHGSVEGLSADEVSRGNHVTVDAHACDMVLSDGGSGNRYSIEAQGCANGLWSLAGTAAGVGENNIYEGTIADCGGRLAWISQWRSQLNLTLKGRNTDEADFGLLLDGDEARGRVSVSECRVGAWVNGNRNNIDIAVRNCVEGLVVAGDGNVIQTDVSGDLVVLGDANIIRGRVSGPITDEGKGNEFDLQSAA